jgi:diguanylate cyclase (GGDEF)-like protein
LLPGVLKLKIRSKLVIILFSVTLVFFGIGFLIISNILLKNVSAYEGDSITGKLQSAQIIIGNEKKSLESTNADWADWDDTYRFIQDQNEEYKAVNFNEDAFATLNVAAAAVYGLDRKLLYSVSPAQEFDFLRDNRYIEKFTGDPAVDRIITGLVMENGKLLIVTARPVTNSQKSTVPDGYLLFAREIDAAYLDNIGKILGVGAVLTDPGVTEGNAGVSVKADTKSIRASAPLYDILGNAVLSLTVQDNRHIFTTFMDAAGNIALIYVLALMLSVVLIYHLISVALTKPVVHMGKALSNIHPDSGADIAMLPVKGKNEISGIAKDINKLLGRVAASLEKDKKEKDDILFASYHDILTGLYNRRFIEEEFKRLDTEREYPLSILMGDVNGLKLVNDAFGHLEGDRVLRRIADAVRNSCRSEDIVARWGGDEYLALIPQTPPETLLDIAKRIRKACSVLSNEELCISIALGFATKFEPGKTMDDLIKEAESMMYDQKMLEHFSSKSAIVDSIMQTLQMRSHESQEHAVRMKLLTMHIADEMNLSEHEKQELSLVAVLHDVGKISVKDSILNKKGPLTENEWKEIRKHPETGYRILQNIPDLAHISKYVLLHHEKWDGTGYPHGLKGGEIPLLCRIVAVVDAFDAMTNDRSYRAAMSPEDACQEILNNSGTQFDPDVVEKFIYSDAIENFYGEMNLPVPSRFKKPFFNPDGNRS